MDSPGCGDPAVLDRHRLVDPAVGSHRVGAPDPERHVGRAGLIQFIFRTNRGASSEPAVPSMLGRPLENGSPTTPAGRGRCPGQARRAVPRSPSCGGQRWRRNRLPMYRPQHTRQAMMIKTVNMARSFGEPGGHEPSAGVSRVLLLSLRWKQKTSNIILVLLFVDTWRTGRC